MAPSSPPKPTRVPDFYTYFWITDGRAQEAATFYTSIFPSSSVGKATAFPLLPDRSNLTGPSTTHPGTGKAGDPVTVEFTLANRPFLALSGPKVLEQPDSVAISLQIICESQEEVDHYTAKLGEGGDESRQICGWVCDKYGISWQVVPKKLPEWIGDPDGEKAGRAFVAMGRMKKLDLAELEKAWEGKEEK
jgi:predicted 3-demethylubiquinone-9 3-methyltransferase (glyoxalase superfamily)